MCKYYDVFSKVFLITTELASSMDKYMYDVKIK